MSGGIRTANCSRAALYECSEQISCPVDMNTTFHKSIRGQLWRVNALLVVEAVLAGVIVGIGAYGQRYRHHPITRFLFLGATTLFLPIISYVASTFNIRTNYFIPFPPKNYSIPSPSQHFGLSGVVATCSAFTHMQFFVILASLVQIVMINTSTIVSVDDREGQCKGPPLDLLVQGAWTFYLYINILERFADVNISILFTPYALLCSKIGLGYFAFEKARRSVTLGRNPGLVFVYMQQLQTQEAVNQHVEPLEGVGVPPPPLLVMKESEEQVERHPRGYAFKDDSGTTLNKNMGLVTVDRVWQLDSMLPIARPWLKDLCLSFALFKLLRCRFARYKLTNSGSAGTLNFFRSLVLEVGEHDVFRVIVEELSFVHDYYYSSLPISYSKGCLPFLNIFLSLLTLGYCIFTATGLIVEAWERGDADSQLLCAVWCVTQGLPSSLPSTAPLGGFFDEVPLILLLLLVVTAEIRTISSYICSNWTKVTLICHYINRGSSQHSLCMHKWVNILLSCRCKLMKHWDEEMSQCSVLVLQQRTSPLVLVRRLLRLPDHRRKVKVPAAVKACIMSALRSSFFNGGLSNGAESLRRSQGGESFLWACNGKGTSDIILTWHIATCILEVKHPYRPDDEEQGSPLNPSSADHKIAATHLSKYCAYLVAWSPELLPDNNAWSKGVYEAVKKDADRALTGLARLSTLEDGYQKLVDLLGANSKHEVLKNGVKLGKELVETTDGEDTAWKMLAEFWSEMILYVAPSDNLNGHLEAIARGGELITVLWALLFHAGIVSRPGEEDGAAPTSAGPV